MSKDKDLEEIRRIAAQRGTPFVRAALDDASISGPKETLTIVSNAGIHPIPQEYVSGELYIASEGNLDFSNIETVAQEYDLIIRDLHKKLLEKGWKKIYLFPFGHSTLCMAIKIAVYRTLRIETVDVFYFGNGRYEYLERDTRNSITQHSG